MWGLRVFTEYLAGFKNPIAFKVCIVYQSYIIEDKWIRYEDVCHGW